MNRQINKNYTVLNKIEKDFLKFSSCAVAIKSS